MHKQPLNIKEQEQCIKDAVYRVDCLMAYDLFLFIHTKYKQKGSVYATGHVLNPAFETSLVFGRQLLEFLQIKKDRKADKLKPSNPIEDDDVTISRFNPNLSLLPFNDPLTTINEIHLVRLINTANKATAHFTKTSTTDEAFNSLEQARRVIYELMTKYVPEILNYPLIWKQREYFLNAIQK